MGDALAIATMSCRQFTSEDYALLHPRGALGRRLLLTVGDVMRTGDAVAIVTPDTLLKDVLFAITAAHAGAAIVTNDVGRLLGLITDGDLRRALLADEEALRKPCLSTSIAHRAPSARNTWPRKFCRSCRTRKSAKCPCWIAPDIFSAW